MKLAISLATRGRPDRLIPTVEESRALWGSSETELWVMVDEDDWQTVEALKPIRRAWKKRNLFVDISPREDTVGEKWNRILRLCPDADVYTCTADDDPHKTPDYDVKILEAATLFPDGIGFVFGQMANAHVSRSISLTAKLAHMIGYICPDLFPYWFEDHWKDDIAKLIGRISYADITTDQLRPGKTIGLRDVVWWTSWFDAAYPLRVKTAWSIIDSPEFDSPKWEKDILKSSMPLLQYNSAINSEYLRGQSENLEKILGTKEVDDRYKRIVKKAQGMLPQIEKMNDGNPYWPYFQNLLVQNAISI